jgi:hypothetical protein
MVNIGILLWNVTRRNRSHLRSLTGPDRIQKLLLIGNSGGSVDFCRFSHDIGESAMHDQNEDLEPVLHPSSAVSLTARMPKPAVHRRRLTEKIHSQFGSKIYEHRNQVVRSHGPDCLLLGPNMDREVFVFYGADCLILGVISGRV